MPVFCFDVAVKAPPTDYPCAVAVVESLSFGRVSTTHRITWEFHIVIAANCYLGVKLLL